MLNESNTAEKGTSKILLRIVFIIAIIIAVMLLALTIIRYTPRFFSYIGTASASLFNVFKKEAIEVNVSPQTVISGDRVIISWTNTNQESVSLSYVCSKEYSLAYLGGNSTKMPMPCGKDFELGGKTSDATLIPTLVSNDSFTDIEIFVNQKRSDNTSAKGSAVITVTSGAQPTTNVPATTTTAVKPTLTSTSTATTTSVKKPTRTNTTPQTGGPNIVTAPAYTGPADLVLSQPIFVNGLGATAVQFNVSNFGGNHSGAWELEAKLPNGDTFKSGSLAGIASGGSLFFTLNLGSVSNGTHTVQISVDPNNRVSEANESNNKKDVTFTIGNGGNNTTSGKADLVPRVLSIGYINGNQIGIRFEIRNNGGTTAKDWRFEAELPTSDDETFRSDEQIDLKPGESIEYTLGFDNPDSNSFATINVDSDNDVKESNENNNDIRFRVTN